MANFRIYNDCLCPEMWDSAQHLDPYVRINLLRMAYDFYKKTNLPSPIIDVYLMGSIANYNWTKDSDVDVHVIIDYRKLQMPEQTANKTVKTAGAQWNQEHNIFVKGRKVEMNIQNASEPKPYVTGIYSLMRDQWVRTPSKVMPQIDRNVIRVHYKAMQVYLENAIRSGDREQMKAAKKYLDAYRQYGLDTYGELSYENIVFKILRSRGTLKQLKDSMTAVYDKELSVDEVGERDIKQVHPNLAPGDAMPGYSHLEDPMFDRSLWDKQDYKGKFHLDRLTMDELKALRAKAERSLRYIRKNGNDIDPKELQYLKDEYLKYSTELKRRIKIVNAPIMEMPQISRHGKKVVAGDEPLKGQNVEKVVGNIVVIRQETSGGFIPEGWTLVYFMDSEESAEAMKSGKVPYLLVPVGTFHSGGSPITDIWKKRFQKPGHEHILGVMQGHSDNENIFIDMLTVRPGFQRNHIAKLIMDRLQKTFPDAKITTSSRTDKGAAFCKGYGIDEGVGAVIPESNEYNAGHDFLERHERELYDILSDFKRSEGNGRIKWKTISARLLKKTWLQFGKYKRIDENDLDKIADQILTNIVRLTVCTELSGHINYSIDDDINEMGFNFTDKEWEKLWWHYLVTKQGSDILSDYGLGPLQQLYSKIFDAKTQEEKFYACDKALNVVHQRNDLCALFIEGGTATLTHIANMGGYNAGGEYGDINREFRMEGVGAGIPEDDRLKITNQDGSVRRWQVRSKDAPKTPKFTDKIVKAIEEFDEPQKK